MNKTRIKICFKEPVDGQSSLIYDRVNVDNIGHLGLIQAYVDGMVVYLPINNILGMYSYNPPATNDQ